MSWRTCSSVSRRSWSRACCVVMPATRSSVAHLLLLDDLELLLQLRAWASRSAMPCSRRVELLVLLLGALLPADVRSSIFASSARRSSSACLGLRTHLEHALARLDVGLAAHRLGVAPRVREQALGLERVRRGACARELLVHEIPGTRPDQQASDDADHDQDLHCPLLCRSAGGAAMQARSMRSAPVAGVA